MITINEKKLPVDALEIVSGGSRPETADDSRFLNVLLQGKAGQCDRYGEFKIGKFRHDNEIVTAWQAVGVQAEIHSGTLKRRGPANVYKINGNTVTHAQAMQHAMDVVGRHLNPGDWQW